MAKSPKVFNALTQLLSALVTQLEFVVLQEQPHQTPSYLSRFVQMEVSVDSRNQCLFCLVCVQDVVVQGNDGSSITCTDGTSFTVDGTNAGKIF